MSALHQAIILYRFSLIILLRSIQSTKGECPKHEALLHNFKPTYFLDKGGTIKAWAKLIPEPWEDNRLIGSLSNTEHLKFKLTSSETLEKQVGVISREVTAAISQKEKQSGHKESHVHVMNKHPHHHHKRSSGLRTSRSIEAGGNVLFTIKAFSEDPSCITLKAETNITVGCPVSLRIFPRGKPVSCDGFKNYTFVVPRHQQRDVFLDDLNAKDKIVKYDFLKLGCPFTLLKNEPFKPVIDLYDGETFVKEVDANYILWEQHSRTGYQYSATMKQAGCISEAQSWEEMVELTTEPRKESAWSKANYHSCFDEPMNHRGAKVNLDKPYQIMNSSVASSHVLWNDVGLFVFTLKVVDPEFSFCDLTMEVAVQVNGVQSMMEEIPTFVVLSSSCFIITILILSAYFPFTRCSD